MPYYPSRPEQRAIAAQLRTTARIERFNQQGTHKRRSRTLVDARAVLNGGPLLRTYARELALRAARALLLLRSGRDSRLRRSLRYLVPLLKWIDWAIDWEFDWRYVGRPRHLSVPPSPLLGGRLVFAPLRGGGGVGTW